MQFVFERMTDKTLRTYDDFPEFFAALPQEEYMREEATVKQVTLLSEMMRSITDSGDQSGGISAIS